MDEIVSRYADDVYRLAYYYMGNHHDAEDIAQKVFLISLTRCDTGRESEQIKAWLLRVTSNECKNFLGSFWRRRVRTIEDYPNLSRSSDLFRYADLHVAIGKLSFYEKEVIWLYYFEELSTEEIAARVDRRPATVRTQLARARKKLGELLEEGRDQDEPADRSVRKCYNSGEHTCVD